MGSARTVERLARPCDRFLRPAPSHFVNGPPRPAGEEATTRRDAGLSGNPRGGAACPPQRGYRRERKQGALRPRGRRPAMEPAGKTPPGPRGASCWSYEPAAERPDRNRNTGPPSESRAPLVSPGPAEAAKAVRAGVGGQSPRAWRGPRKSGLARARHPHLARRQGRPRRVAPHSSRPRAIRSVAGRPPAPAPRRSIHRGSRAVCGETGPRKARASSPSGRARVPHGEGTRGATIPWSEAPGTPRPGLPRTPRPWSLRR